jgi:hypothetical protein
VTRRAVLIGALVWVLVVAVASGVTWAVIEGAGQNLLAGGDQVAETQTVPAPASSPGVRSSQPSEGASDRRPGPAPSAGPSQASGSPTGVVSRRPTTSTPPQRTSAPAPEVGGVERTWEGPPGLVTVRCDGSRTTLRSATPNNGYRVEVDRGTVRIEAHFQSAAREYKVVARCSGGVPRFAVEGGAEDEHDE